MDYSPTSVRTDRSTMPRGRGRLGRGLGLAAAVLAIAALLAGCGSSGAADVHADSSTTTTPSPSTSPVARTYPPCAGVWHPGRRLPAGYHGCAVGGERVAEDVVHCETGQRLVTHGRYYAVAGATIRKAGHPVRRDRAYQHLRAACGG